MTNIAEANVRRTPDWPYPDSAMRLLVQTCRRNPPPSGVRGVAPSGGS